MTDIGAPSDDSDYLSSFEAERRASVIDWHEKQSIRAEERADLWIEKGLRSVFILNAGGVLALLTSAGVWQGDKLKLEALVSSANLFIAGLVVAALGTVGTAWYFNAFSKKMNDLFRLAMNSDLTVGGNDVADERMSKHHSMFQYFVMIMILISFLIFICGAISSLNAVRS